MVKIVKYILCAALIFLCCLPLSGEAAEKKDILPPSSAKIYREPSEKSVAAANLITGNAFEVLGKLNDEIGTLWYKVRTDFGVEGYVKAAELEKVSLKAAQNKEIKEDNAEENTAGESTLETGESSLAAESEDGAFENITEISASENDIKEGALENAADEDALEDGEGIPEGIITLADLNLREKPYRNSKIAGKIKKNTTLPYLEKHTNDAGETWYRVTYDGISGYVFANAVKTVQGVQAPDKEPDKEPESAEDEFSEIKTAADTVQEDKAGQEETRLETEVLPSAPENGKIEFDKTPRTEADILREMDWMMVCLAAAGFICMIMSCVLLIKIKKMQKQLKNRIGEEDASNSPKQAK